MNCNQMYENVMRDLGKFRTNDERFENLFLLVCMLIYCLGSRQAIGDDLDTILSMVNEFDYKKNFDGIVYREGDEIK